MLFARFQHIYTHKFESAYADTQTANMAKKEWALSLTGFSQQQIEYAIEQCKDQFAWPPSISEFKALMLNESSPQGLPSVRNAYVQACRGADHPGTFQWSHELVYLAAKQTDFFLLRSESEARVLPIFERHYQQLCQRWQAGEDIDIPIVPALPAQTSTLDGMTLLAQLTQQYDQYPPEKISQLFF